MMRSGMAGRISTVLANGARGSMRFTAWLNSPDTTVSPARTRSARRSGRPPRTST